MKKFRIIFYAYLVDEIDVFVELCDNLVLSGIAEKAEAILLCVQKNTNDFFGGTYENDAVAHRVINNIPNAQIVYDDSRNLYEYPGLAFAHICARETKDDVTLYMHTKGIANRTQCNKIVRTVLSEKLIYNWEECINKFDDPTINKVGLYKSLNGFCWFNFFWVRNSFLISKPKPVISEHRHDYENYIQGNGNADTFGIASNVPTDDGNVVVSTLLKENWTIR